MRLLYSVLILLIIIVKNVVVSIDFSCFYLPELTVSFIYIALIFNKDIFQLVDLLFLGLIQDLLEFNIPGISVVQNFFCILYNKKTFNQYYMRRITSEWLKFSLFILSLSLIKGFLLVILDRLYAGVFVDIIKKACCIIVLFPVIYCVCVKTFNKRKKIDA